MFHFTIYLFSPVTNFSFRTGSRRHQQEHSRDNIPLQLAEEAITSVQNRPHPQGPQHTENHNQIRRVQRLHKSQGHEALKEAPSLHSRRQRASQVPLHLLQLLPGSKRLLQLVQLDTTVQRVQHNQARVQGHRRRSRHLDDGDEWEGARQGGVCGRE